ncbi:MAG: hypothetical protein ACRC3B_08180 [Bacteroidia bacterium]
MLKKILPALFFAFLLASCGGAGWNTYETDTWSVEFPGTPKDSASVAGDASSVKVFYEPQENKLDSNVYYSVSNYTMKDSLNQLASYYEKLFHGDVQVYAWGIGGILADSVGKPVKAGNISGYEYRVIIGENAGLARIRKFALGRRVYTVLVLTENAYIANVQADYFLNSFRFKVAEKASGK